MIKKIFPAFMIAILIIAMPSIVNATFTNEMKLLASDGAAYDYFGGSVSINGDTAIAGAYGDDNANGLASGSAYIYVRDSATGVWTEQQKLIASDGATSDSFGISVSVSGDTAIVGASSDDDNGSASGSAYVFVRDSATGAWTEQQKLIAFDGAISDAFGHSVSISGDTVIVGAYGNNDNGSFSGSAYVFVRNSGVWTLQQKLLPSDNAANDYFGFSVSIDGETAIAGIFGDDDKGSYSGSAYVFVRSGITWTEQQKLTASDGTSGDYLGYAVSINGDTAIAGAYGDNDNGSYSGSAYIFVRSGTTWTEQQKLTASDGVTNDYFGFSVSNNGDTAIAGAYGDDDNGSYSGSAFIFVRDPGTGVWTEQKLLPSDGVGGDDFGWSVSVSGDTVMAGAYIDDDNGLSSGSAYLYERLPLNLPFPDIKVNGSDGPVTLTQADTLSLTVELTAGVLAGVDADWWILINTPIGWYYFDPGIGSWAEGQTVTLQGPLFDLAAIELLNGTGLPAFSYDFFFAVDMVMNGSIDVGQIYYDSVSVTVTP